MTRFTVVGTGFAALTAVQTLRARDPDVHITVVGPTPNFTYYPSLIWLPSGMRHRRDVVVPLTNFFSRQKVEFHAGSATGIEEGGRRVLTDTGTISNDGLIIAAGATYAKKPPGIEHVITPCEGFEAADAVRKRLSGLTRGTIAVGFAGNPHEPAATRGGPMFEFLFGLHTQLGKDGRRGEVRLVFFTPMAEPGKRLGAKAVEGLTKTMSKRGIETHLGHKLKAFEANKVITEAGDIPADLILFTPPMTGSKWFDHTELPRSPAGFIQADAECRVPGWERVYVAGDAGSFPGPDWLPKQAHMADLQAAAAAENLLTEVKGGLPHKTFRTELICVVDDLRTGMLVARTPKRSVMLPPLRAMHWSKRLLEWWYLRKVR